MKLQEALKQGEDLLKAGAVPSPRLNAEVLLMHAAQCDRTCLYAHGERELTAAEWARYSRSLKERREDKPTQYITGHQEFWGLDFLVNPSVLIPRPETEVVVEVALDILRAPYPAGRGCTIADVGTGSGCIAIALATELPEARVIALEKSPEALETARVNAARLGVESRITFHLSDLLKRSTGERLPQLQIIVSNPPYVSTNDAGNVMPEVSKYEPTAAVFAGESGLETYARLIPQAAEALSPGGSLVLELGYDVKKRVRTLLEGGDWEEIGWRHDLAGITRVASARRT
jgi:release factor glutamine methyltransferase